MMVDPGEPGFRTTTLGPSVAGTWYPSDARKLEQQVDGFLRASGESQTSAGAPCPVAFISPHAGFVYSGAVAGACFARLEGRRARRVLLLGPSHYAAFQGGCLPAAGALRTPLGSVPIDRPAVERLADAEGFHVDDDPFGPEHCLEAELPFLQRSLEPGWSVVPILLGGGSRDRSVSRVIDALAPLADADTLVVVSSDFTHYGPGFGYVPFRELVPERIRQLDMGAVDRILDLDREGFRRYVSDTGATICGRVGIDVLLGLLDPDASAELVAYDTSGRMTGDWSHSVSYAGLSFAAASAAP
jgi:AmmeMemoRadiSam system protein B